MESLILQIAKKPSISRELARGSACAVFGQTDLYRRRKLLHVTALARSSPHQCSPIERKADRFLYFSAASWRQLAGVVQALNQLEILVSFRTVRAVGNRELVQEECEI